MKKLLLSLALFATAIGVNAQTQVTNETVSASIVDGAVISLQCQDTNGGVGYYFNGDQVKSASFQPSNLFAVVGTENGFYLQQKTSGKYVGGATTANALVQLVDDQSSANVFTAAVAAPPGWTTKPTTVEPGVNTIRFTTGSTFLNTNSTALVPKYFNGTGGFSAWYVYSYTEEEVNEIIGSQVDVTFTFPAFGGQTLTMTIEGKTNVDAATIIPAVPFFTATGVEGDNVTVTAENTEFTVTGDWTFPFEDEEVYRIDIRKKGATDAGTCSNLLYNASANQV
ncbi:MAG: hypothetical protein E7082_06725, partial [Bacteroidales bacterium]|nr:hypothetical protein [Bacteroidales bacterium]